MKRAIAIASLLAPAVTAWAQVPMPQLQGVYPPGGKAGTVVRVTLRGADLDEPTEVVFSHPGIKAAMFKPPEPVEDPKTKKKPAAAPVNPLLWDVTIDAKVPVGRYEMRAVGRWGISSARAFVVSALPEVLEVEPNDTVEKAQPITVGAVINGQTDRPADLDWYKIKLAAGKRVVFECAADDVDSKMSPMIQLQDSAGREIATSAHYAGRSALIDFTPPAEGDYYIKLREFTYLGTAVDYYYRLGIHSLPQIDYAYPPVVQVGKPAAVTLFGRNLPGGKASPDEKVGGAALEQLAVQVTAPAGLLETARLESLLAPKPASVTVEGFNFRLDSPAGPSNPVLIGATDLPVILEAEPNNPPEQAQAVTLPAEIVGRFGAAKDFDTFRFDAKKGEVWRIEVISARVGAPGDPAVIIGRLDKKSVDGKMVETGTPLLDNLDEDTTAFGLPVNGASKFEARSEDPRALWTVPADGSYYVQIRNLYGAGQFGTRFVYRLRIRPAQPDFRVAIINPEDARGGAVSVSAGCHAAYQVIAGRYDGFDGTIKVEVQGLPKGVTCPPTYLGPAQVQAPLVFRADDKAEAWAGIIRVVATATIAGKTVTRDARGAQILDPGSQQGGGRVVRVTGEIALAVRENGFFSLESKEKEVSMVPGGKVDVEFKLKKMDGYDDVVTISLFETAQMPTQNQQAKAVATIAKGKDTATVPINVAKNQPYGKYTYAVLGQGTVNVSTEAKTSKNKKGKATKTYEPSNSITVNVAPPFEFAKPAIPARMFLGESVEVPLTVKRLAGVTEDIKVALTIPGKSASADALTLAKGSGEGKFVIKTDPKAAPGPITGFKLLGTVAVGGNPLSVNEDLDATLEVVAPFTVALADDGGGKLVAGTGDLKVKVKVTRAAGYDGEIKLVYEGGPAGKTVTADAVTVPKGQSEATLTVKADAKTPAGNRTDGIKVSGALSKGEYATAVPLKLAVTLPPKETPKDPKKK